PRRRPAVAGRVGHRLRTRRQQPGRTPRRRRPAVPARGGVEGGMRRIAVHMQTTFNNRIANADGGFWEPFAWGEEEMAYLNQFVRTADPWAGGDGLLEPGRPHGRHVGVEPEDVLRRSCRGGTPWPRARYPMTHRRSQ